MPSVRGPDLLMLFPFTRSSSQHYYYHTTGLIFLDGLIHALLHPPNLPLSTHISNYPLPRKPLRCKYYIMLTSNQYLRTANVYDNGETRRDLSIWYFREHLSALSKVCELSSFYRSTTPCHVPPAYLCSLLVLAVVVPLSPASLSHEAMTLAGG